MTITIVGLGPGDPRLLTRAAWEFLSNATEIYVRTRTHPAVSSLPGDATVHSFDHIYGGAEQFSEIYTAIADEVLRLGARPEGVIYAVPGHPMVGEASTRQIRERAQVTGVEVRIIDGISFIEPVCTLLNLDPLDGLQIHDAMLVAQAHHPPLDPALPALLGQLYSRTLASDVKLTLLNAYPEEHPVTLVQAAGTTAVSHQTVPLYELDRLSGFDFLTSLYVPPLEPGGSFTELQEVIAHLRSPEGCPWDREQTHLSLRRNLLEETYEVLEALDALEVDDSPEAVARLSEELGDFLLQVVLQTQIATDEGEFRMADVVRALVTKLIRRHPHVFGDVEVADAAEVTRNWDQIKRHERGGAATTVFAGVPKGLPALLQAQALYGKAARSDVNGDESAAKEVTWLEECIANEQELGALLWQISTWAVARGWDAEAALRAHNERFVARVTKELNSQQGHECST